MMLLTKHDGDAPPRLSIVSQISICWLFDQGICGSFVWIFYASVALSILPSQPTDGVQAWERVCGRKWGYMMLEQLWSTHFKALSMLKSRVEVGNDGDVWLFVLCIVQQMYGFRLIVFYDPGFHPVYSVLVFERIVILYWSELKRNHVCIGSLFLYMHYIVQPPLSCTWQLFDRDDAYWRVLSVLPIVGA